VGSMTTPSATESPAPEPDPTYLSVVQRFAPTIASYRQAALEGGVLESVAIGMNPRSGGQFSSRTRARSPEGLLLLATLGVMEYTGLLEITGPKAPVPSWCEGQGGSNSGLIPTHDWVVDVTPEEGWRGVVAAALGVPLCGVVVGGLPGSRSSVSVMLSNSLEVRVPCNEGTVAESAIYAVLSVLASRGIITLGGLG